MLFRFAGHTFEDQSSLTDEYLLRKDWTIKDYLNIFLSDEDFENMCNCTNVKYMTEHEKALNLTLEEVKKFVGITILISCLRYPRIKMFWAKTTRVESISKNMTRDRYFTIRSHLKVTIDNEVPQNERNCDKLWKVRPILDRVKKGCLSLQRSKIVAIDEQMIPFTGVCGVKQFVRGKPNPEGLKNFVCATPEGLVLDFEIYQGKSTFLDEYSKELGVGPSAVVRLIETLKPGTHIFIDRYFTTIGLLEYLLSKKIVATGTIMKSRVPASVHLTHENVMKKMTRGSNEQTVRNDEGINIVQWYDRQSILIASTQLEVEPLGECKRWSKKDQKYIYIPRPNIIKQYNDCMGGIDLIDRMISYYRINSKTRKWTVKTILHFLDLSLANAWILYRQDRKMLGDTSKNILDFLDFKVKIADQFLQEKLSNLGNNPLRLKTRNSSYQSSPTPSQKRKKRTHLPAVAGNLKNSVRCKMDGCSKKTKFNCTDCGIFLCVTSERNCFFDYHTKFNKD